MEASWERRRIVPALDMACVKAPFSDGDQANATKSKETPSVEHMWMSEIDFDGKHVSGVLLNSPNWLTTVKEGDSARIKLNEISDWMYAISGVVYGAYTVNLIRSRMGRKERQEHDNAWGLEFGDPDRIRVVPEPKQEGGLLKRWFGPKPKVQPEGAEHPASEGMAAKLKEQLAKDPNLKSVRDDKGRMFLHQEALAGNLATVQVLLQAGGSQRGY